MVQLRQRTAANHDTEYKPRKSEPATDDEPLSSSAEEELDDGELSSSFERTPKAVRLAGPTLKEKLAASSQQGSAKRSPLSRGKGTYQSPGSGSSRKRPSKEMSDYGATRLKDDDAGDIFGIRSSQSFKKRRPVYGRKSDSFQKPPSSSMEEPSDKVRGGKQDEFKTPMDIDVLSPPAKEMGFKQPPPLPPCSNSSSSLVTSSLRDVVFGTDDEDDDDSSLSSAPSFTNFDCPLDDEILEKITKPTTTTTSAEPQYLCPMCREPVPPELLIRFQAQPNQRIREQQKFCESHKMSSAEKEWQEKGYPTIDWAEFDDRIQSHFDELEKILVPDSTSYYRNVLDTMLKSGTAKNFRLTLSGDSLETISCGYYGTRGAGKMLQAITDRFARKLRRLAADDHIVKKAGVVVYSQAVLVPELAVRLVKEDMGVNDESARQILRESIEIGEKLNFALNDSVPVPEEPDDANPRN